MPLEAKKISMNVHRKKPNEFGDQTTQLRGASKSILAPASLTVEAALVFPLFFFVLVGMLFFFRVLETGVIVQGALEEAGCRLSLETEAEEEPLGKAIAYFYASLAKKGFSFQYIRGGRAGILWTDSELSGEYLDMQIRYDCKLPVPLPGVKHVPIAQRMRIHKWIGFEGGSVGSGEEDIWVYVTPNGSVYHMSKECTHLRLSIKRVSASATRGYSRCELCGKRNQAYYYVTEEGNKYHSDLGCSGLKRTVYMVRLSEVGGKRPCSRCGGG